MRVCHVSRGICPRAVKLAWVQMKAGFSTSLILTNQPTFQRTWPFEKVMFADEQRFGGYQAALSEENKRADVFHVHTHMMDNWVLADVRKWAKKPVVWDCHDLPIDLEEKNEPRLVPTESFAGTVYRTYCPKDWFQPPQEPEYAAVISTGLSDAEGHWRNWLPVFTRFYEMGIRVKCYTQSMIPKAYKEHAEMCPAIDISDLMTETAKAEVGICGSPFKNKKTDEAYPNKLFEYVAAGIPVICIGDGTKMAEVVKKHDLGIVVRDYNDIDEMLTVLEFIGNARESHREKILAIRGRFAMEGQEPIVREFYKKAMK